MCGFAGVVGIKPNLEMLKAMADVIRHRGPDDEGYFLDGNAGLAFRRLSIVDLETGQQPMGNEDGRIQLVFNGEIYDHHLLRATLHRCGHVFSTDHADTEVLVHGWEEWGTDLFQKLNGMMAVAIWDRVEQRLVLARDRYGIKPLYYAPLPNNGLVFASEIKAIHASGLVPREPSPEGIYEYFAFQNIWREQTMFKSIYQLDPGVWLTWQDGKLTRSRYWDITFPRSRRGSLQTLAEEHREILGRVIRRQVAADVPISSYLSGGIDSTAITVAAYQVDPSVNAYSCIFDLGNVGEDAFVDEREFSRLVAKTYQLRRVEHILPQDSLIQCLDDYVWALEDLRMGMGYPVYLIAQRVAQDVKVVLSGTGGDEFHAGYVGRYQSVGLQGLSAPITPKLWDFLRKWVTKQNYQSDTAIAGKPELIYRGILNFLVKPAQAKEVLTPQFLHSANGYDPDQVMTDFLNRCPSSDWRDRVMYGDAKTYLAGLLVLEDKVSMAHSLETRVPLLDNELVDFVLDVPFELLWKDEVGKVLFRESVRPWVPEVIYHKTKMGFGPPDASWYRGRLRPWIESMLTEKHIKEQGIFQPKFVRTVLNEHFTGQRNWAYMIWSLLNFEAWSRKFGFLEII